MAQPVAELIPEHGNNPFVDDPPVNLQPMAQPVVEPIPEQGSLDEHVSAVDLHIDEDQVPPVDNDPFDPVDNDSCFDEDQIETEPITPANLSILPSDITPTDFIWILRRDTSITSDMWEEADTWEDRDDRLHIESMALDALVAPCKVREVLLTQEHIWDARNIPESLEGLDHSNRVSDPIIKAFSWVLWNNGRAQNGLVGRCWPDPKSGGGEGLIWIFFHDVMYITSEHPVLKDRSIRLNVKFMVRDAIVAHLCTRR